MEEWSKDVKMNLVKNTIYDNWPNKRIDAWSFSVLVPPWQGSCKNP